MKSLETRMALGNIADLTTPVATQEYKLGLVVTVEDSDTKVLNEYIYVKAHTGLTAYQPYIVTQSGTAGAEWITAAPATIVSAVALVGVPQVAFTADYYGFVQIRGVATSLITSSTGYVTGNNMKLTNGATSLVAATTGTAATINTAGFLITNTTGTSGSVMLAGNRIEITT
jgi:hypothetical protein